MLDNISALQQCASINALNRLHDRLVVDLNQRRGRELIRDERGQTKSLPRPPIPEGENIEPVDSQMDLIQEGKEMHHCIASHLRSVVDGKFAVYRMTAPERLTISTSDGRRTMLFERGSRQVQQASQSTEHGDS